MKFPGLNWAECLVIKDMAISARVFINFSWLGALYLDLQSNVAVNLDYRYTFKQAASVYIFILPTCKAAAVMDRSISAALTSADQLDLMEVS